MSMAPPASVGKDIAQTPGRRQVWIVTTPVKGLGPTRKFILNLIMRITGSQLTWAMHWAIRIDDTYLELQRVPESPKPTLLVSCWTEDKKRDIVTSACAGTTTLSNGEIVAQCAVQYNLPKIGLH